MTPPPSRSPRVSSHAVAAALDALRPQFGDRLTENPTIRTQHANTLSRVPSEPPDAVIFPLTTDEVAAIVRTCAAHSVPMIPFGTGTSFEGHVNAPRGGLSIDTLRMKRIVAVNADDLDCVVEAGVTRMELNDHVRQQGLFFPIDPGADASLGGMAATRASGTNAVRYGTMRDNVLALTVVLPNGEIVRTAGRARKSSAGYDLTRLLIGAEGTLGILTEVTLRLHGLPEQISAGHCPFPDIRAACDTVIRTIQCGVSIARIELLDEVQIKACNAYSRLDLPETPTLFVEFHGGPAAVAEQVERFGDIAREFSSGAFVWADRPEDRTRLWTARHNSYWAACGLRPGAKGIPTDVCVPISQLADCIGETKVDIVATGLVAPIIGHVGDGNFHVLPLVDDSDKAELERAFGFVDRMVARAIAMEGTCTGEHGIGQSNRKYMALEFGDAGLALMRTIKRAIDPLNVMNPGKILFD
ncbi:MAG: FAD-binding protein [Xanthobacteraceae bacterium]|nr:MAG: FAD-binding protein [Xanthobacteraceae bacterium]